MRRQALHSEGTSDADTGIVSVWLVVEIFDIGARSDGVVDLFLAREARAPPFFVRLLSGRGSTGGQLARKLPFLPTVFGRLDERGAPRPAPPPPPQKKEIEKRVD